VIHCANEVKFDVYSSTNELVSIVDSTHHHDGEHEFFYENVSSAPISIRRNSWICNKASVLTGVRSWHNAVVASHAVVNCDVCDGMRVLDVGSGRGEVVFNAAKSGATAVGIDYASAALSLARGMLGQHPEIRDRVLFLHGDARCMPLVSASFDRAFMLDVVEHL